jgi:hypothetical protein
VAIPRKEHRLLSAFLHLNEGKSAEIFKRSGLNTRGHREKDVHIDRKVFDGDERITISKIAGRKLTLVRNIPVKCKEEFENVMDTAKFMPLLPTGEKRHLCVCMEKMLDEIRNEHNWGHNS